MINIAIIGGGIGGLTAALALRQFGFAPDVYEQAPALHDVGAAIAVWPNAMRILEGLGVADKVINKAGVIDQIRWLDREGRFLNHVSILRKGADKTSSPAVALHRADLQNILLQSLPPTSIHLGETFLTQQQPGATIEAHFFSGHSITCDVLIGADGIHSRVREQFVDATPLIDRGYTVWRGISPVRPADFAENTAVEIHGRGQRFGIGPLDRGRTGWWATANRSTHNQNGENPTASQPADTQLKLLTLFEGWCHPVLELIKTTPSTSILTTEAFDRRANRNWGSGRLTLLGDAIHPTTPNLGQGGCMAIEDSFVLAKCLQKYQTPAKALRTYENLRYRRTAAVARYSRNYGAVGQWEDSWVTGARDRLMSLLPESLIRRLMGIVLDYDANELRI
jgi:2-polyprenyl-6-methoxyphenol hydroxylase-like FAD-dependent oxidoreductase